MSAKLRILVIGTLVTVPLDQLTKYWIAGELPLGGRVPVIDGFFYLTHVRNAGAAFGLLTDLPAEWRVVVFGLAGVLAAGVIVYFYRDLAPGDRVSALALALILGGAIGNFSDRILRGEVIDFLYFRLIGGYTWPDFNFADVFIVLGVSILAIELLAAEGRARAAPPEVDP